MDYKDFQAGHHNSDHCWVKARGELIEILAQRALYESAPGRLKILNLGAGTGDDLKILNKFGDNYVIDISNNALSLVVDDKLCVEKKVADACKLPYQDGFFDAVVSFDVFEHIENDNKAINEVYRVLKSDGVLIFTVPAFQFLYSSHDKALEHFRRYSKQSVTKLMLPFSTLKLFYWNSILFIPLSILRILKKKSKPQVDSSTLPSPINNLFYKLLTVDNFLIGRLKSMPLGLSIVGWCRK